jgi:hypothetical protein
VDGATMVKAVTRQLWRYENLTGNYYGGDSGDQTSCGADNGHWETEYYYQFTHNADNTITIRMTDLKGRTATINGTYAQFGHMGQVSGTGTTWDGVAITVNLFEIERTISGITGRGHMVIGGGCTWDGRWGGVRR